MQRMTCVLILGLAFTCGNAACHKKAAPASTAADTHRGSTTASQSAKQMRVGCASCIFHMKTTDGCPLAVELDGKHYIVDGVKMDSLGDAHAADGLCNVGRNAMVTGHLQGDRFVASSVVLLPQ